MVASPAVLCYYWHDFLALNTKAQRFKPLEKSSVSRIPPFIRLKKVKRIIFYIFLAQPNHNP
jgi:hypothetical protein